MNGDRFRELGGGTVAAGPAGASADDQQGVGAVGAPWFVQFWPLFILFLMVVSVGASVATVVVAYRHADEDVRSTETIDEGVR